MDQAAGGAAEGGPGYGAFVVSLDFELHWGIRDRVAPDSPYRASLIGARGAVPRMLELFEEFGIAATWATVGMLFASTREELARFHPAVRPRYADARLDPFGEAVGAGEEDDPVHFGGSLVERILRAPGQEVATHTYSHFYCLEPGQTREAFRADLESAAAIAREKGVRLRSIVFPRNQHNPDYDRELLAAGIQCFRGNARGWMYRAVAGRDESRAMRAVRLLDAYIGFSAAGAAPWGEVAQPSGLCNVPASLFLRPSPPATRGVDRVRLGRIRRAVRDAARRGRIFHLWWHPHNFGVHTEANLKMLRSILETFARCRDEHGMRSLSMAGVAEEVRTGGWNG